MRVAVTRPSSGHHQITNWRACWAAALTLHQPYRCMVPAHGSSLKPPPDTTPDDAGDPSRVVFCLDGSERVRISSTVAGAHLRWLGSHARGDPQKQRRHHARTRRGFFGNPRLFCAPTSISRRSLRWRIGHQADDPRRGPAHRRQHRQAVAKPQGGCRELGHGGRA